MKKIIRTLKYLSLIFGITLLNGCIYQQMELKKFPLIKKSSGFYEIKDDVVLAVKALNKDECKGHFGVDITTKGFVALQVRIENRTPYTHIIRPSYLSLPLAEPEKVSKLLHHDTSFFVTTAGAIALLFWWPATYWVGRTGYDMYRNNKKINQVINDCSIAEDESIKIMPYEVINKFIFVNRYEFLNTFTLKIFNKNQGKILNFFVSLS